MNNNKVQPRTSAKTERSRPCWEIRVRPKPGLKPKTETGVRSPLSELLKLLRPISGGLQRLMAADPRPFGPCLQPDPVLLSASRFSRASTSLPRRRPQPRKPSRGNQSYGRQRITWATVSVCVG